MRYDPLFEERVAKRAAKLRRSMGMPNYRSDLHDVTMDFVRETEKAICVSDGTLDDKGKRVDHWLPKSQIEYEFDNGRSTTERKLVTITAPEWLLKEKGLI